MGFYLRDFSASFWCPNLHMCSSNYFVITMIWIMMLMTMIWNGDDDGSEKTIVKSNLDGANI